MKYSDGDIELGERLQQLRVPEHRPGFFAELEDKLEAEAESRQEAPGIASASRMSGRRSVARTPRTRRSWLRLAWIPIPVTLVILALLWAFAGPLGIDSFRPESANAAEITQKAAAAIANTDALRGTLVVVASPEAEGTYVGPIEADSEEKRFSLTLTADGDFRLTGLSANVDGFDMSYDHETGVRRLLARYGAEEPLSGSEASGLAVGPPDPSASGWNDLGAAVRALRESSDAQVREDTYEDQAAWILSADLSPNLITNSGFDHLEVTVLEETGLPVRAVYSIENTTALQWSLSDLEIDPELAANAFVFDFPAGVQAERADYGFTSVDVASLVDEARAVVGYVPVLPSDVPDGFVLTEVRVAEMGQPSGKEGMNPATAGVVSAIYRRGFDRLIISTRTAGDAPSLWADPLASGEGFIDNPETITLGAGVFAGSEAELVINIRTLPHLWAINDSLVVTVSGDLTRAELLDVAESLAPVE